STLNTQHLAPFPFRAWRVATEGWERAVRAGYSGWAGSTAFEFRLREALPWNMNLYDPGGLQLLDGGTAVPPEGTDVVTEWAEAALAHPSTTEARAAATTLAALNVGYLVSPLDLRPAGCSPVRSAYGLTLYRVPGALPQAYLATTFVSGATRDLRPGTVSLEDDWRPEIAPTPLQPGEFIEVVEADPRDEGRMALRVHAAARRLLVVTDRAYPGWR